MKVKVALVYWCKCGNSEHPHKGIRIFKTLPSPHGQGKPREYRIVGTIEFCCIEMEKAYDENFIQFKNILNTKRVSDSGFGYGIPIGCGIAIIRTRCFPECTSEDEMYITLCPFCGKEVVVEGL